MRALILTAAVVVAVLVLSDQATAANPHHQANVTLAAHHGPSGHGYPGPGGPHHGYPSYHHHRPSYHHGYYPPVYVRPQVVVPYYYSPSPYGYYRGYGYYHGGVSVNTGRVGISIGF